MGKTKLWCLNKNNKKPLRGYPLVVGEGLACLSLRAILAMVKRSPKLDRSQVISQTKSIRKAQNQLTVKKVEKPKIYSFCNGAESASTFGFSVHNVRYVFHFFQIN